MVSLREKVESLVQGTGRIRARDFVVSTGASAVEIGKVLRELVSDSVLDECKGSLTTKGVPEFEATSVYRRYLRQKQENEELKQAYMQLMDLYQEVRGRSYVEAVLVKGSEIIQTASALISDSEEDLQLATFSATSDEVFKAFQKREQKGALRKCQFLHERETEHVSPFFDAHGRPRLDSLRVSKRQRNAATNTVGDQFFFYRC